ncbi:MAG TPA: hypothetical protein PLS60_06880, partial [Arenimonas sp.]|nr:hypothetical protein [Arenimonas sp.]
ALIISTVPSLIALSNSLAISHSLAFGVALIYLSYVMYIVLTHYSGAVPSEYYSAQKRPGYAEYQRTTNMFFPGPRKHG